MSGTIFLDETYPLGERSPKTNVVIHRSGDLSGTATVNYRTGDYTAGTTGLNPATAGSDYIAAQGSVTFKKNQANISVPITLIDDSLSEGPEAFSFAITSVSSGANLGTQKTAVIRIEDNEAPSSGTDPEPPPTIQVKTEQVLTGVDRPISFDWVPGSPATMVVAEKAGQIKVFGPGTTSYTLLDLRSIVNDNLDRGLLDIELHPNFATQPYLYAYYAVDPPETTNYAVGSNQGPDGSGNRYVHLVRYKVNTDAATGRLSVDPTTKRILLGSAGDSLNDISGGGAVNSTDSINQAPSGINPDGTNIKDYIAADSLSHAAGGLEFGPDGLLYVTVGDGTSYNFPDPRAVRVQDIGNLSGKVLRIDPETGNGLASNPFYNGDPGSNESKLYQIGVRNAFRLGFDGDGDLFLGDVGWYSWEEINTGGARANFGWPYYEGGQGGVSLRSPDYSNFSQAQDFYRAGTPVVAPFQAFSHSDEPPGPSMNAIVFGDVYTGSAYPSWLQNQAFFSGLNTGEVFVVPTTAGGTASKLFSHPGTIVFMDQGPDGRMYFADISNGTIGRWQISTPNFDLRLDSNSDRVGSTDLSGSTVSGNIFVFLQGEATGVQQVQFLIDGRSVNVDRSAPWDLVGGNSNQARPFDTRKLSDGDHSISAIINFTDGRTVTSVTDSFWVQNGTSAPLAPDQLI